MPSHENENRKITYHFVDAINDESPFRNVSTAKLLDFSYGNNFSGWTFHGS